MIQGRAFSDMSHDIRMLAPKSQSYKSKVGITDQKSELQGGTPPGGSPESEANRPEKSPNGV